MTEQHHGHELLCDGLERIGYAQQYLKLSRSGVYGLMDRGILAYVKIGRSRRIPRRALLDLAARGLVIPPEPVQREGLAEERHNLDRPQEVIPS